MKKNEKLKTLNEQLTKDNQMLHEDCENFNNKYIQLEEQWNKKKMNDDENLTFKQTKLNDNYEALMKINEKLTEDNKLKHEDYERLKEKCKELEEQ